MLGTLLGIVLAVADGPIYLVECHQATIGQPCDTDDDLCSLEECRAVGPGVACVPLGAAPDGTACTSDGAPCTQDVCRQGACAHEALAPGAACDDGSLCTIGETCDAAGVCGGGWLPCDDGDPCTADACGGHGVCSFTPTQGPVCDDADPCMVGDVCGPDGCRGTTPAPDGTPCVVDDPCAVGACAAGACVAVTTRTCGDGGVPDGGAPDGGAPDGGAPDGGAPDGGPSPDADDGAGADADPWGGGDAGSSPFDGAIGGGGGCAAGGGGAGSAVALVVAAAALAARRRRTAAAAVVAVAAVAGGPAPARADGIDITVFQPGSPGSGGFVTDAPGALPAGAFDVGLWLDVARDPLVVRDPDTGAVRPGGELISDRSTIHLAAAIGLPYGLELALGLPVVATQAGDLDAVMPGVGLGGAPGDLAIGVKAALPAVGPLGVAAAVDGQVPLGDPSTFTHDAGPAVGARLIAGLRLGRTELVAAAGRVWRSPATIGPLVIDDEWVAEVGARHELVARRLWLVGDAYVAASTRGQGEFGTPAEAVGGVRARIAGPWVAQVGVGAGLTHGYGTASVRGVAMIGWAPDRRPVRSLRDQVTPPRLDAEPAPVARPRRLDRDADVVVARDDGCVDTGDCAPPPPRVPGPQAGEVEVHRVVLEEKVLFDTDRARVKRRARKRVAAAVEAFQRAPEWERLIVEGYADERGSHEYNVALGLRRAEKVRALLVELGVPADRIEVVSFGEKYPKVRGTSERARQRNRRVEIVAVRTVKPGVNAADSAVAGSR